MYYRFLCLSKYLFDFAKKEGLPLEAHLQKSNLSLTVIHYSLELILPFLLLVLQYDFAFQVTNNNDTVIELSWYYLLTRYTSVLAKIVP